MQTVVRNQCICTPFPLIRTHRPPDVPHPFICLWHFVIASPFSSSSAPHSILTPHPLFSAAGCSFSAIGWSKEELLCQTGLCFRSHVSIHSYTADLKKGAEKSSASMPQEAYKSAWTTDSQSISCIDNTHKKLESMFGRAPHLSDLAVGCTGT